MKKPWVVGVSVAVALALFAWGLDVALKREAGDVGKPPVEDGEGGTRSVELTFPGASGGLAVETREIAGGDHLEDDVRRVVEELIAGPSTGVRALPAATRLLDVFFDGEGELTLNFSDDLRTDHPGGSAAEMATLHCLIATIAANFPAVDRVRVLVDGETVSTLAGHADLSEPLKVEDYR
ncbi:MAG: GerMN domain-containing protein [bacterium]